MNVNLHAKTVEGFGEEWSTFDQSGMTAAELTDQFDRYFSHFPWDTLSKGATGFDLGCGSGRWAREASKRVGRLHCIDASNDALNVARRNLVDINNIEFHHASVDNIPLADNSMDFGYSLGVLHHIPDTPAGIASCVVKLKLGAPFLVYLYYAFDNRPAWFRLIWKMSDGIRRCISSLPFAFKKRLTDSIALLVYLPFAMAAGLLEKAGLNVDVLPLSTYRNHSFYTMRTDALDRFGTRLERRFTRTEIREMMESAGLERIRFNESNPYWCAIGYRK